MSDNNATKSLTKKQHQKKPTPEQVKELANQLSAVLTNPLTPAMLFNDLAEGLNSLEISRSFHQSPEYLSLLLASHFGITGRRAKR